MLGHLPQPLPPTRSRPSDTAVPPNDVTDVLLWRMAVDVAAAHTPDHAGNCTNLACTTHRGQCEAANRAEQALRLARAPRHNPTPTPEPSASTPETADRPAPTVHRAVGHAAVTYRRRFTGWFTSPAPLAPGATLAA